MLTKEPVVGATILAMDVQQGTDTDAKGRFEMNLPFGAHPIEIQYIGYQGIKLKLGLYESVYADIEIEQLVLNLSEVIIRAKADNAKVQSTQIGVENLEVKSIKQLPTALGEVDVVKALESLPGVSTVGEGA